MTSQQMRTVGLGVVLAILVVPLGGPYVLPVLLLITGIVVFDLYRQAQNREAADRGEAPRPTLISSDRSNARRGLLIIAALFGFFVLLYVVAWALR